MVVNLIDGDGVTQEEREPPSEISLAQQFSRTAGRGCQETVSVHLLSSALCSKAKLYGDR